MVRIRCRQGRLHRRERVGKISTAPPRYLKRVTLELGGKSPVIVLPDVDVEKTARGAATSIFANSGQVCIAGSRLFAHRDIFDQLIEAVAASAGQWKVGPSLAPDTRMGPLVSTEQHERSCPTSRPPKEGASVRRGRYALRPNIRVVFRHRPPRRHEARYEGVAQESAGYRNPHDDLY